MSNFSLENFKEIFSYPKAHADVVKCSFLFKPNNDDTQTHFLITISEDNSIKLWDTQNNKLLRSVLRAHLDCISSSAIFIKSKSSERLRGLIVVTTGGLEDCSIKVWDIMKQNVKLRIRHAHRDIIKKIEFIKRENQNDNLLPYLMTLSYDATFKIWDISKGNQIKNIRLDFIGENFILFKSLGTGSQNGAWAIGVLDFQRPKIHVYEFYKDQKKDEITGFYSNPTYDRDISIQWWNNGKITYFVISHRYGCVIWNYEGNYKVYEICQPKALFPTKILTLRHENWDRMYILFSSDKVIYSIEFKILGYLLSFIKKEEFRHQNIITQMETFLEIDGKQVKVYFLKFLNTLSYNWISLSYQNIEK